MNGSAADRTRRPFFLDRDGRRLFCLLHCPADAPPRGGVVFFAPFAEEMNRSRRMATLLGEALGERGIATLVFDYTGTGDSSGAFADARWEDWVDDGRAALAWLATETGGPVSALGLRLGAALALLAASGPGPELDRFVLWQPVTSGTMLLTQFLRVRIAAALGAEGTETTGSLRERLAADETLEIAGYALTPALAAAIDAVRLSEIAPAAGQRVDWLEVTGQAGASVGPASAAVVGRWRDAGVPIDDGTVKGEPFWAIQETTTAPFLIAETVDRLAGVDG